MTQREALKILKTGANVFLTGEPGSGKTYVINEYVKYLRAHGIEPAVTASTGIAATHIHGQTIHSWSGIGIRKTLSPYDLDKIETTEYLVRRIRDAKVLIIDEISMIDANTLNMVDIVCKNIRVNDEAFGGIQVILVGDFFQLPPIKKDGEEVFFAFDAHVWQKMSPIICYLTEQYRQSDEQYRKVLSSIRKNELTEESVKCLEKCLPQKEKYRENRGDITQLFSHNMNVDMINQEELEKIPGISQVYFMSRKGKAFLVDNLIKGCLSPERLELKIGAVVMCTKNNAQKGYVNGTLGTIISFEPGTKYPIIKTISDERIVVEPSEWVIEENGRIKAQISQIPLRLAWAITIHKSQGMSLDSAIIDLSEVFEYGQGYVALSRIRSLEGLTLLGWNKKALQVHPRILLKDQELKEQSEKAAIIFGDIATDQIDTMHKNFILASGGSIDSKQTVKKKKEVGNTLEMTLMLILQQKKIEEIAKMRGMTVNTIYGHLEKLVGSKKISYADIEYIVGPSLEKNISDIKKTFINYDTSKLKPVYDHYKGKFSYDQLRLAKLIIQLR